MTKKQAECCALFTEAYWSKGSIVEGFSVPLKKGQTWGRAYAFHIPGKGRGVRRRLTRSLVIEHCPFCGAPPNAGPDPAPGRLEALLAEGKEKSGGS